MLEINGHEKSGSGTILRISVSLAAILNEPLHIYNIRKRRPSPGLRPQHLEAVITAAKLCDAEVEGAKLGSREIWFTPRAIRGGEFVAEIGTAGSISMLIMTILPICIYAERKVTLRISKGGTDVRNAPTINYMRKVLLPTLRRMGVKASLDVEAYGYYPVGMGRVILQVNPIIKLNPLKLPDFGRLREIRGASVCTFLKERRVAERQAKAANKYLESRGYEAKIDVHYDSSNPHQRGSSLVLWTETDSGVLLGSDSIGELRKTSEKVGREAAESLVKELEGKATTDVHLADMLIPYIGLSEEGSLYSVREMTEHLDTNLWLTEKILKTKMQVEKQKELYWVKR